MDSLDNIAHINAKISREEVSGKFDIHTPMIRKYLLEEIDRLIGDCKGKKGTIFICFCGHYVINELVNSKR